MQQLSLGLPSPKPIYQWPTKVVTEFVGYRANGVPTFSRSVVMDSEAIEKHWVSSLEKVLARYGMKTMGKTTMRSFGFTPIVNGAVGPWPDILTIREEARLEAFG